MSPVLSPIGDTPAAAALRQIAALRAAGYDLIPPGPAELARLQRGTDVVSIRACEPPPAAAQEVRCER